METMTMVRGEETVEIAPIDECYFVAAGWTRPVPPEVLTVLDPQDGDIPEPPPTLYGQD